MREHLVPAAFMCAGHLFLLIACMHSMPVLARIPVIDARRLLTLCDAVGPPVPPTCAGGGLGGKTPQRPARAGERRRSKPEPRDCGAEAV